jgi:hypothetical protein
MEAGILSLHNRLPVIVLVYKGKKQTSVTQWCEQHPEWFKAGEKNV